MTMRTIFGLAACAFDVPTNSAQTIKVSSKVVRSFIASFLPLATFFIENVFMKYPFKFCSRAARSEFMM
jgi:hypothetical protein